MRLEDLRIGQRVIVVGQYAGDWQGQIPEIVGLNRLRKGGARPVWVDDVTLKDSSGGCCDGVRPYEVLPYYGPLPEDDPPSVSC